MRATRVLVGFLLPALAFGGHSGGLHRLHEKRLSSFQRRTDNARLSWYDITTNEVACGGWYQPNDHVVALNSEQWDGGSHCGESVSITYQGKTVSATIVDECGSGCPYGGLDLTHGLFQTYGSPEVLGIIYGDWSFGSGESAPKPETTTTKAAPKTTSSPEPSPTPTTTKHSTTTSVAPTTSSSPKPKTSSTTPISTSTTSTSVASSTAPTATTSSASVVNGLALGLATVVDGTDALTGVQNFAQINEVIVSFGVIVLKA